MTHWRLLQLAVLKFLVHAVWWLIEEQCDIEHTLQENSKLSLEYLELLERMEKYEDYV